MSSEPVVRRNIPRAIRFEVLKRDKFTCQYCGASAPDVVLHVDHINPASLGGEDDITNLVTACEVCNVGKSNRVLSDDSSVKKSKRQLDELQARREQLEAMMEWKRGLKNIEDDTVDEVSDYWNQLVVNSELNEYGINEVRKLLKKYSVAEVTSAMETAVEQYVHKVWTNVDPNARNVAAFWKIAGICRVNKEAKNNPEVRDMYYVRGILLNRIRSGDKSLKWKSMKLIKDSRAWGVSIEDLKSIAKVATSWYGWESSMIDAVKETVLWKENHAEESEQPQL